MRALIGAFGTRGDVQPMLSLAEALIAHGHSVSLAVPPNSLEMAKATGLEAFPAGMNYENLSKKAANGSLRNLMAMVPEMRGEISNQLSAMEKHAGNADIIIGASVFTVGALLSEWLNKPFAYFAFCPQIIPSGDHPSPLTRWQSLPRWANRATWAVNSWSWAKIIREELNGHRKSKGLNGIREDVWSNFIGPKPIIASDPILARVPTDSGVNVRQVGALFMREKDEISATTRKFVNAGPPPVYIGFGSMSDPDPLRTTKRILEAVQRAKIRALISRGWAGLDCSDRNDDVLFIGPEPHGKLFPLCSVAVHHGGAGTTHAALRAGIPQIIMPQLMDQFYWGKQIAMQGLGIRVPRYGQDPNLLAEALKLCTTDARMANRSREAAQNIQLNGAEQAVTLLEEMAA